MSNGTIYLIIRDARNDYAKSVNGSTIKPSLQIYSVSQVLLIDSV